MRHGDAHDSDIYKYYLTNSQPLAITNFNHEGFTAQQRKKKEKNKDGEDDYSRCSNTSVVSQLWIKKFLWLLFYFAGNCNNTPLYLHNKDQNAKL